MIGCKYRGGKRRMRAMLDMSCLARMDVVDSGEASTRYGWLYRKRGLCFRQENGCHLFQDAGKRRSENNNLPGDERSYQAAIAFFGSTDAIVCRAKNRRAGRSVGEMGGDTMTHTQGAMDCERGARMDRSAVRALFRQNCDGG